jgi:hypothetical protein
VLPVGKFLWYEEIFYGGNMQTGNTGNSLDNQLSRVYHRWSTFESWDSYPLYNGVECTSRRP